MLRRRGFAVAALLGAFGASAPAALATTHSYTATTNLGRTCTIVFQGGSTTSNFGLTGRLTIGGSISCNGGPLYISHDTSVYDNGAYPEPVIANLVGGAAGGKGASSCGSVSGNSCSDSTFYDSPHGWQWKQISDARLSLASASYPGPLSEYFTGVSGTDSDCYATISYNVQHTLQWSEVWCQAIDYLTAA
jgi:hypothetical protein